MTQALHELAAPTLIELYRRREVSPVEVARSVLGHVERWEHHLDALFLLRPEQVLEQARESEARWLRGAPLGLIDGVPVTIKDNIATQGDPMPLGTAAVDRHASGQCRDGRSSCVETPQRLAAPCWRSLG